MTGQLEEEKMQVYVRLGIRLLYKVGISFFQVGWLLVSDLDTRYKGASSRMEGGGGRSSVISLCMLAIMGVDSSAPPQVTFHQARYQVR